MGVWMNNFNRNARLDIRKIATGRFGSLKTLKCFWRFFGSSKGLNYWNTGDYCSVLRPQKTYFRSFGALKIGSETSTGKKLSNWAKSWSESIF